MQRAASTPRLGLLLFLSLLPLQPSLSYMVGVQSAFAAESVSQPVVGVRGDPFAQESESLSVVSLPPVWASPWGANSSLLRKVQQLRVFADSKDFVDSPLLVSREEVWRAWAALEDSPSLSLPTLTSFVSEHFGPPGSDLQNCSLPDFSPTPPASIQSLSSPRLRQWASALHSQWPSLARCPIPSVRHSPERHTLLWADRPLVVPGGRFRENYMWDSLWICQGLVRSNMAVTAQGIVHTLAELIATHGFIPNGGRSYYSAPGRSQPPVFSSVVWEVVRSTGDLDLLEATFESMSTEYGA
jgi:alpha,alpha-trehalase